MKIAFTLLLSFLTVTSFAQDSIVYNGKHFVKDYPEGRYVTLEDFLAKKVSPLGDVYRGELETLDTIPEGYQDNRISFVLPKRKKLKNVFAVSYKGDVYIQEKSIMINAEKGDKSQVPVYLLAYTRVLSDGNFFYIECRTKDIISSMAIRMGGGLLGAILEETLSDKNESPIIFDFQSKKFNIIRNNKDFDKFLKSKNSPYNMTGYEAIQHNYLKIKEIIDTEIKR